MEAGAGSWYVSKEEIEHRSPSRRDGVGAAKEAELRGTYCSFLRDVGLRLQLPHITIATAIVLCHRFYLRQSHAKNEWQTIATVCIFLASKIEDTPCPLQRVVTVAYETMYRKDPDAARRIYQKELLEKRKALILVGESLLLSTIRFDFNIQHPYEPLKLALKNLGISQKEVKQAAFNLVNDTIRTTLVVQFKPHYIAAGSLFVAAKFNNLRLPSENGKVWWNQFDVAPKQLQDVIQQITQLYMRRNPCSIPAVKPTPTPIPTPQEKQQIISIPEPVLKFTYSRRGLSMSTPTPAPTVVKKHQIIGTTDNPIPAPTEMKKQQIISTPDPVPVPTAVKKQQIISTPDSVPVPTAVKKQQIISTPDPVPAPTVGKKQQIISTPDPVPVPTAVKKQQIISTPDPVPAPTVGKKEQIISTPDPVPAPTEVKKQQSCTPAPATAKKQHTISAPDPVPAPAAVKKQQKISTPDPVPRHTRPSRTSLISNSDDREACRYMPVDSLAHQYPLSSARNGDRKSVRTHADQGLNKIAMHGRSEKQSSLVALKGDRCLDSPAMDRGRSEKSSRASLKVDHSLNSTRMDERWSEKQSSRSTLKAGRTLSSIVIDERWTERQSSRPAPKGDHGLDSTGMDGRWSEKSPRAALKDHRSLNSTGLDGRWSEKHSSLATVKADPRLISTGMDRRWSEKESSWAALKANHAYDARSVQKDISATGITNLIGHKRRIQESGERLAPVDKFDRGAWTGRQFRSMIVVETKPPSWKRQKYY